MLGSEFERRMLRRVAGVERELERRAAPGIAPWGDVLAMYQGLLGLRGFWPLSGTDDTGAAYDLSGQGRTLTYNGNPVYGLVNSLAPYLDLDGTGDYLSRPDEAGLDITGAGLYATPGLTLGGWFYTDDVGAVNRAMLSKYNDNGVNQRSFMLYRNAATPTFVVSNDGAATVSVGHTTALTAATWYWCAARFTPSSELAIWLGASRAVNTVGVPATLFNSNSAYMVGGGNAGAGYLWLGNVSQSFLCAAALPDALIELLFQRSRVLFGV